MNSITINKLVKVGMQYHNSFDLQNNPIQNNIRLVEKISVQEKESNHQIIIITLTRKIL